MSKPKSGRKMPSRALPTDRITDIGIRGPGAAVCRPLPVVVFSREHVYSDLWERPGRVRIVGREVVEGGIPFCPGDVFEVAYFQRSGSGWRPVVRIPEGLYGGRLCKAGVRLLVRTRWQPVWYTGPGAEPLATGLLKPGTPDNAPEVDDPIVRAALQDDPALVPSNAALVKTIEASMDAVEDLASRMAPVCQSNINLRRRLDEIEKALQEIGDAAEAARLAVKVTLQRPGHPMTGWLLLPPIGARVRITRDYDAKKNQAVFGRDAVGCEGVVGSYELCPRRGIVCRLNDVTPCYTGPGYATTARLDEIEPADAPAV